MEPVRILTGVEVPFPDGSTMTPRLPPWELEHSLELAGCMH